MTNVQDTTEADPVGIPINEPQKGKQWAYINGEYKEVSETEAQEMRADAAENVAGAAIQDLLSRKKYDFPLEHLPECFRQYCEHMKKVSNLDTAMLAPHLLVSVSAAIGNSYKVMALDNWEPRLNLWVAVVAPAGSKKTAANSSGLKPLKNVTAEWDLDQAAATVDAPAAPGELPVVNTRQA